MGGSVFVHVMIGAVFVLLHRSPAPADQNAGPLTIEVIEAPPQADPKPVEAVGNHGGGSSARNISARVDAHPRVASRSRTASVANEDPRGEISIERDGDGLGDGGAGHGRGGGHGDGLGMGAAGSREVPPPPPPPAPDDAVRVSKARPARLVYPKRNREVADGETFVARVTVDADGYVVGARLVRGFGGRRDDDAASLIFKFRYAPALDDDGRPIRSTLDQNFLVE